MSFIAERVQIEGFKFDDMLLVPTYSDVLARDVNLTTHFSRRFELKIPIASAAIGIVTESKMAIAIVGEGGNGVIHKTMTIAELTLTMLLSRAKYLIIVMTNSLLIIVEELIRNNWFTG